MNKQAKAGKETFGLIIGTRAYFNSELAIDVRSTLLAKLDEAGYGYVILDECDTPTGGSMETLEDGKKCAALFRKHRPRQTIILEELIPALASTKIRNSPLPPTV